MDKKKFIITQDEQTAQSMISSGFTLVSHIGIAYTFLNDMPKNFSFANFDKSKIAYSNILTI